MSSKSERRAAREAVAAYHEAQLAALVERVGEAVDRFRDGELDAFEADLAMFQYSRAAKELWKFCNIPDVDFTARMIADGAPADWWDRGAPRQKG
jgi:predicted ester cyclase